MAGAGAKPFVNAKIEQRVVVLFAKRSVPECGWIEKLLGDYRLPPDIYEVAHIESRQDVTQIDNYFQTLCLTDTRAVSQPILVYCPAVVYTLDLYLINFVSSA